MDEEILKILEDVKDPEVGFSVVDLGLIYDIEREGKHVKVTMTLTTPGCPLQFYLISQVEEALRNAGYEPEVVLTFDPPWTPDRMSERAKKALGVK